MTTLDYFLFWYSAGLLAILLHTLWQDVIKKQEITITINDLGTSLVIACLGFLLWIIPIAAFLVDLSKNYGKIKYKVIWKNKRAKNREILFGDIDNDRHRRP